MNIKMEGDRYLLCGSRNRDIFLHKFHSIFHELLAKEYCVLIKYINLLILCIKRVKYSVKATRIEYDKNETIIYLAVTGREVVVSTLYLAIPTGDDLKYYNVGPLHSRTCWG